MIDIENEKNLPMIDPEKVIQARLEESFGLSQYKSIMDKMKEGIDISNNADFKTAFNGFYRVRRGEDWRKKFYELFQEFNERETKPTFKDILNEIHEKTECFEPSFSSKMLATLDPKQPIWDQNVLQFFGLTLEIQKGPDRTDKAVENYNALKSKHKEFCSSENGEKCLEYFDKTFPKYTWISKTKKIDFIIWGKGGKETE